MGNFKLIKTAAALALGASVVTSAVVTTDASAASKYKIKSGKLVYAKSGKVVKGYVTYKSTVYKNGSKLTGLKGKTYYKAGKKATGTYKGAYYVKGVKKVTTGTYNKAYYVKGVKKVSTGLYASKYYKDGKLATGTYKGAYYVKGLKKVTTGTYNGAYYVKGKKVVSTGLYADKLYVAGKLNKGYKLYNENLYKDAALNAELVIFEEKLYDGAKVNEGIKEFDGKWYNNAAIANGVVTVDGEKHAFKEGVKLPLVVEGITAINTSVVEVAIAAPKADVLKATVEVKDGKGNIVPVKTVDVSAGDKTVAFTFDKTITDADFTGVWTIDGVEYNFDVLNQFKAIKDASTDIALYDALKDAGITSVNPDLVGDYKTAIQAAISADKATKVSDIQPIIDQVNKEKVDAVKEKELVKALNDAKTSDIKFLAALQANFTQVNKEWFTEYKTALSAEITASKDVQDKINQVNETKIGAAYDKAFKSLATADIQAARELLTTYGATAGKDEFNKKGYANDSLDVLAALAKVDAATTNNTLKTALVELDALETKLVEKYKNESAVTVKDEFDVKEVKEEFLADYRAAVKVAVVGSKNQRKDIATIITTVNSEKLAGQKTATVDAVKAITEKTTEAEVVKLLQDVQTAHRTANQEPALNKVNEAYAKAYKTEITTVGATTLTTADAINTLIGKVNGEQDAAAQLLAVNEAKTVAEMTSALTVISLTNGTSAAYINLSAANKAEVAELVLAAKKANFVDATKVSEAVDAAVANRSDLISEVNKVAKADFDYTTVDTALKALNVEAYNNLDAVAKLAAAQKFHANVPTTTVEGKKVVVEFVNITAIKEALVAATK
ncbi:hypothetical protein MXM64_07535 [Kurthia gibsonii]|uniref:hypothetical protein n=1 Tax=Kurthia gibsonii TaxID=33946 RepID=UPI002DBA0E02|nr:hypothetical protein [Kurthia gibsonii]MEB6112886.1 hypothetical protein [Kurthia gibsonii]